MRVLNTRQMLAYERWAMGDVGLPEVVLMENAAQGVMRTVVERYPEASRVLVLIGPGNNGGDGLAVVRLLHEQGVRTDWIRIGAPAARGSLCAEQERSCRALGLVPIELDLGSLHDSLKEHLQAADLVVDALLGTGVNRPLEGDIRLAVEALRDAGTRVVSVDLPTGLDASTHLFPEPCVQANVTATFAAPKVAHVMSPARECCGEVVVLPLGASLVQWPGLGEEIPMHLMVPTEARGLLSQRPLDAHKGNFGHVLVVGGSVGLAGAVVLAAQAAVRTGAGLVTAAVPAAIRSEVEAASLESMTLEISGLGSPGLESGGSTACDVAVAAKRILEEAERRDVLAVGPGLGRSEGVLTLVRGMLKVTKPLVLDADGLNALGEDLEALAQRSASTVLTPHPGELGRLLGCTTSQVQDDRVAAARSAAKRSRSVVVLKGHQTLTCTPSGEVWINTTGNPGMATGGSGDVLTGLLAGFLAQGYGAPEAARLAVFLHGLSGDLAAKNDGESALAARDLIEWLGRARTHLEDGTMQEATRVPQV